MNILQTLAVFVGIPVLIYAVIAVCTLIPGRGKKRTRYRTGQPWDYPPQWWAGDQPVVTATTDAPGIIGGGARGTW